MNQKIKITIYSMIIACCTNVQKSNAQWANFPTPILTTFNQTSQPNREESGGIGDFNGQVPPKIPLSAFHINTNFGRCWNPFQQPDVNGIH